MGLERNSWEEILVVVVVLTAYSVWALRDVQHIGVDVAGETLAYFYIPLFVSSVAILAGPGWYAAALFALGVLLLGLIASSRSGLFQEVDSFPLFTRFVIYLMPFYPVAGLAVYYLMAPWGGRLEWWIVMAYVFANLILSYASYYQLRHRYPPRQQK